MNEGNKIMRNIAQNWVNRRDRLRLAWRKSALFVELFVKGERGILRR